jgi:hypothetical protein
MSRSILCLVLCLLNSPFTSAQPLRPAAVSTPPLIDGRMDDVAWTDAPSVSNFITFAPDFGKTQEQRTVVWMVYDPANLYFAFRCYDDPGLVKTSLAVRDNIRSDDWVCINLDTFGDQQGLTALYVNPHGIQMDSRYASGKEDFSVDLVWYSAGSMTDDGYVVEVQIPLKSIRYRNDEQTTMSVFFERYISRRNEHGSYPAMDPSKGFAFFSQMIPMVYTGLEHRTLFEVLPGVTFNQQYARISDTMQVRDVRREGSLTLKYGITSDLVLDGTYNPDFSQVEADAGQVDVNLRTNLFFAEKRPFFLEGRELFNLGGGGGSVQSFVYTRAIVDPKVGLRLTGKIGEKNTVAVLMANDEIANATDAQFGIVRYRRSLSDDSYVGGIGAIRGVGSDRNMIGGADAQVRVGAGSMVEGHFVGSSTRLAGASTSGHALSLAFNRQDRDGGLSLGIEDLSPGFQADMGFIVRAAMTSLSGTVQRHFYPVSDFWNRVTLSAGTSQTYDQPSRLWEMSNVLSTMLLFRGNLAVLLQLKQGTEVFLTSRFNTNGVYMQGGGQFTKWLGVTLIYRYGNSPAYALLQQGRGQRAQTIITLQPNDEIRIDHQLTYQDLHRTSDDSLLFSYPINRIKATYQFNKYLFFRVTAEYNGFRRRLPMDALVSFTYIPGTVIHAGFGSIYERQRWDPSSAGYVRDDGFLEKNRGFFFKASYLWRI